MRTRLSSWQIPEGLQEESGQMKYTSVKHVTNAHVPDEIRVYFAPFPEGIDGIMVKTIRVRSEENLKFTVTLLDGNTEDVIYESYEEVGFHYDQVDIPYKPSERGFFIRLHNKGSLTTKFHIEIRGIEVK